MKAEPSHYLCLAWLSEDRVVLGTDTGKVQLFEVGEVKNEFDVTLPTASEEEATRMASRKSLQKYVLASSPGSLMFSHCCKNT
jgi:hypothetical protein